MTRPLARKGAEVLAAPEVKVSEVMASMEVNIKVVRPAFFGFRVTLAKMCLFFASLLIGFGRIDIQEVERIEE